MTRLMLKTVHVVYFVRTAHLDYFKILIRVK
jgi:hypothetical protein